MGGGVARVLWKAQGDTGLLGIGEWEIEGCWDGFQTILPQFPPHLSTHWHTPTLHRVLASSPPFASGPFHNFYWSWATPFFNQLFLDFAPALFTTPRTLHLASIPPRPPFPLPTQCLPAIPHPLPPPPRFPFPPHSQSQIPPPKKHSF